MMISWLKNLYHSLPVLRELKAIKAQLSGLPSHHRLSDTAALISALEALKAGNERYRDPQRLLVHGAQYFSQNYEDGMIAEIFRRIGTTDKTFLEIGVGDGRENNTAVLLATGWKGWWLEGSSECCKVIATRLEELPDTAARLKFKQAFIRPDNVADLLREMGVPREIDIFSLDIDLNTYHIWEALPDFRPRVVVVEYNAAIPPSESWINPLQADRIWDNSQAFGASLKAFELLGRKFGYNLVGCDITGINAFFVRQDLGDGKFIEPCTAENHYEPPRYHLLNRWAHTSVIV